MDETVADYFHTLTKSTAVHFAACFEVLCISGVSGKPHPSFSAFLLTHTFHCSTRACQQLQRIFPCIEKGDCITDFTET